MAEAIIKSVTAKGIVVGTDISVGEPVTARADVLRQSYGVFTTDNNAEAAGRGRDCLFFPIKPQDLPTAASQIQPILNSNQTVVSIVAGAKLDTLSRLLKHDRVIRVMPNTPAQIGQGMSVWTCSLQTDDDARKRTQSILAAMGEEIMVSDEKYLDMATALSASGPAYVFMFIESLIDAGVYLGLPRSYGAHSGTADGLGKRLSGAGDRPTSRRPQRPRVVAGRHHRRSPDGPGGRGIQGRRVKCSGRRPRKIVGIGRIMQDLVLHYFLLILVYVLIAGVVARVILSWFPIGGRQGRSNRSHHLPDYRTHT